MEAPQDIVMDGEQVQETPNGMLDPTTNGQHNDLTDPLPDPQAAIHAQTLTSQPNAAAETTATGQTPTASLAASASAPVRPGSQPPQPAAARPDKPVAHGGPTRQYLNQHITPHLLEGMKYLAMHEPEKPLAWLAEFLKNRSTQIEG